MEAGTQLINKKQIAKRCEKDKKTGRKFMIIVQQNLDKAYQSIREAV